MATIYLDTVATGNDGTTWTAAWNSTTTGYADAFTDWASGDVILMGPLNDVVNTTSQTLTGPGTVTERAIIKRVTATDNTDVYAGKPSAATFEVTGTNNDITFAGHGSYYGHYIKCTDDLLFSSPSSIYLEDCVLETTQNFGLLRPFSGNNYNHCEFRNTDLIQTTNGGVEVNGGGTLRWIGGAWTATTLINTALFSFSGNRGTTFYIEGLDFSGCPSGSEVGAATTGSDATFQVDLVNCIMPTSYVLTADTFLTDQSRITVWASDTAGDTYQTEEETIQGTVITDTDQFLVSGFSHEGDTSLSLAMQPGNSAMQDGEFLKGFPILFRFDGTLNTATTFTVQITEDFTVALTKKNCWMEIQYLATASETLWNMATSRDLDGADGDAGAALASGGTWNVTSGAEHSLVITTNGTTIPHPQKTGIFKVIVYLSKFESTKELFYNPQVVVS